MPAARIARRRFLASMGTIGAAVLLAACRQTAPPTSTPAAQAAPTKPVAAPAATIASAAAATSPAASAGATPATRPAAAETSTPAAAPTTATSPTSAAPSPAATAAPTAPAATATPPAAARPVAGGPPASLRLHVRADAAEDLWTQFLPTWGSQNNAEVQVVESPVDQHVQRVQGLVASGQLGDVVQTFSADSSFHRFFAGGVMTPLDTFIADDSYDLNQFYGSLVEITRIEEKIGGLPFKGHPSRVAIFYNRTLLEAAGAKVPTNDASYDDLIEAAKKAQRPDGQRWGWSNPGLDLEWYVVMSRFEGGKDIWTRDGTKALLNNPSFEPGAGWAWVYDMFNVHKVGASPFSASSDTGQLFASGKLALLRADVFAKAAFAQIKDFTWGMSAAPAGPGGQRGSLSQADVMGVTKASKAPDAAWRLVRGLCSKEAGIVLGKQGAGASAVPGGRPDVYESPELLSLPFPEDVQKNTAFAMKSAELFTQPANYRWAEVQRAIDPIYREMVEGTSKPDEAFLERLNQAIQDVLDKPKV